MFQNEEFDQFFAASVAALRPYLDEVVCVGGCASGLYRHHELARPIQFRYLGTKDIDWAAPQKFKPIERKPIRELMAKANLREEIFGSQTPPVVKFVPENDRLAADLEFLCPLSGISGGRAAQGGNDVHELQDGLTAQPLRYLEVLLHRPWRIDLSRIPEFQSLKDISLRIPNPASYVLQKTLIRAQGRTAQAAAKDCYYIYEVSVIFRDALPEVAKEYGELKSAFAPWTRKFAGIAERLFCEENTEGVLSALRVYKDSLQSGDQDADLSAAMISRSVMKLLSAMK